jgi:hypothetical protein
MDCSTLTSAKHLHCLLTVVRTGLRVPEVECRVTSVWHIFLVLAPTDTLLFKQVYNGGDIGRNSCQVIVVDAIVVTRNCCSIVWLRKVSELLLVGIVDNSHHRRMSSGIVVAQRDAFLREPC